MPRLGQTPTPPALSYLDVGAAFSQLRKFPARPRIETPSSGLEEQATGTLLSPASPRRNLWPAPVPAGRPHPSRTPATGRIGGPRLKVRLTREEIKRKQIQSTRPCRETAFAASETSASTKRFP